MAREPRTEPWPWILATLLASMMAVATSFAWIAYQRVDPEVVSEAWERTGRAEAFHARPEEGDR